MNRQELLGDLNKRLAAMDILTLRKAARLISNIEENKQTWTLHRVGDQ
jgi:hypothetical protein